MDSYNKILLDTEQIVLSHPLCTLFHRSAWFSSLRLEETGFFTHDKGEYIRNTHLTVALDPDSRKLVDLLDPGNPRTEVEYANWLVKTFCWRNMANVRRRKIHQTYTGKLPPEILELPRMAPFLSQFPEFELGGTTLCIYGKKGGWSYYFDNAEFNLNTICVSPDFYGLPTQLLQIVTQTYYMGIYPVKVGGELINGCFELIAKEGHPSLIGVAGFIEDLVSPLGYDAQELAGEFILGNPQPLFAALSQANPLAPALLTFISEEADDTDTSICRIDVMRALDLCGNNEE